MEGGCFMNAKWGKESRLVAEVNLFMVLTDRALFFLIDLLDGFNSIGACWLLSKSLSTGLSKACYSAVNQK